MTVLDGALRDDRAAAVVRAALDDYARTAGWDATTFFLPDLDIAPCAGDFKCWTDRPGVCAINGPNAGITRAIARCRLAIFVTPVTFGGYSYHLKKAIDHLIPNISPLFTILRGEVHHARRYAEYPSIVLVGTSDRVDDEAEGVFRSLLERNAINMRAPAWTAVIARESEDAGTISRRVHAAIEKTLGGAS